jgi:hypothetical protein
MNTTIMAERQAVAIAAIAEQTGRLGGVLTMPTVRAPNPATKNVLLLEAIAEALAGIGAAGEKSEAAPVEAAPEATAAQPEDKPVAKKPAARRGKEL